MKFLRKTCNSDGNSRRSDYMEIMNEGIVQTRQRNLQIQQEVVQGLLTPDNTGKYDDRKTKAELAPIMASRDGQARYYIRGDIAARRGYRAYLEFGLPLDRKFETMLGVLEKPRQALDLRKHMAGISVGEHRTAGCSGRGVGEV